MMLLLSSSSSISKRQQQEDNIRIIPNTTKTTTNNSSSNDNNKNDNQNLNIINIDKNNYHIKAENILPDKQTLRKTSSTKTSDITMTTEQDDDRNINGKNICGNDRENGHDDVEQAEHVYDDVKVARKSTTEVDISGSSSSSNESYCSDRTYDCYVGGGSIQKRSTDNDINSKGNGMMMFQTTSNSSSLFHSLFNRRSSRNSRAITDTTVDANRSVCQSLAAATTTSRNINSNNNKKGIAHRMIRKVYKTTVRMTSTTSPSTTASTTGKFVAKTGQTTITEENNKRGNHKNHKGAKKKDDKKQGDNEEDSSWKLDLIGYEISCTTPTPTTKLTSSTSLLYNQQRIPKTKEEAIVEIQTKLPNIIGETPQEYLDHILSARGYSNYVKKRYNGIETGYYNSEPTSLQLASYGVRLLDMIIKNEEEEVESCLLSGIHHNPCNEYNESIVHTICYYGNVSLLEIVLDHNDTITTIAPTATQSSSCDTNHVGVSNSSIQIVDDFGKTPLHEVCRSTAITEQQSFQMIEMIMNYDIHLFYIEDTRGNTPLELLSPDYWYDMIIFLQSCLDRYWPIINTTESTESESTSFISPLVLMKPNLRIINDPDCPLSTELAWMVSSGIIEPEEARSFMDDTIFQKFLPTIQDRLNDLALEEETKEKLHYENKMNDYRNNINDNDDVLTV